MICPKCQGPAVRILEGGALDCANQCEETDARREQRLALQSIVAEIAKALKPALPGSIGFIVILADHGVTGGMAYASTIERDGAVSLMQELVDKMKADRAVADHVVNTTIARAVNHG